MGQDSEADRPGADPDRQGDPPIRFGTSGWRGIFGQDFTFEKLGIALHGVGRWVAERSPGGLVVVGHDTRAEGERMAELAAAVLRGHGLKPLLASGSVPTPVVAWAVRRRAAAAGVVFTASHNPPEYHGMKVLTDSGGGVDAEQARRIEALAADGADESVAVPGGAPRVELCADYRRDLLRQLDPRAFEGASLAVVYDAMHGAGAGVLDTLLESLGVRVTRRRAEPDPTFGGGAPDPEPERLRELAREVQEMRGLRLGLATDGDADRYGAIDADGRMLSATEAVALLVDHLARTGRVSRGVAISIATGSLVERVARFHGLGVQRYPIGFKHLTGALRRGEADVAGEESGGFALADFSFDKDGILAGCLLAELLAATRAPLGARLAELEAQHGRSVCGRLAVPAAAEARAALLRMLEVPPDRVAAGAVLRVSDEDGLHLALADGFLMLRASGTEPVLRVYAEAPDEAALECRLREGAALLQAPRTPFGQSQGSG